jgi:hypothetical protein
LTGAALVPEMLKSTLVLVATNSESVGNVELKK